MTTPDQQVSINTDSNEFDHIVLGTDGTDVMATAQAIADGMDKSTVKDETTGDAAAQADAEAKAKEEADAKAKADAEAATKAKAEADASASAGKDTKVEGVLLKDGKHVAPYAVLEDARARANAERQAREDAEAKAKELQDELDRLKSGKSTDTARAEAISDELRQQIETLKDAAPEVGGVLDSLVKTVDSLTAQVRGFDEIKQRQADTERAAQDDVNRQVQEAIDANPKLVYAQSRDKVTWNRIADQDAVLRADPAMRGLSFAERFAKAVTAVEAVHGEIKLPPEFQTTTNADSGKTEAEAKAKAEADAKAKAEADAKAGTSQDAKARAEAELKKADEAAAGKPFTLTDLPGGVAPQSADKELAAKSPDEIANEVERFLEKGGRIQDIAGLYTTG